YTKVKYEQDADIKSYVVDNKKIELVTLSNPIIIKIIDIGIGGIFFASNEFIGIGQVFNLDLMDSDTMVSIAVRIIRTQKVKGFKMGYGCQFINLNKSQELFITSMVFKLQSKVKSTLK
ncbi:MAG: PilZ domain-containing protein, partial [Coprobacillus sp.]